MDNYNFSEKKAIVRVDFNVPLDESFNITDDTRIKSAIPTIKKILKDGGAAIVMSHLGRPKDAFDEKYSLKHILKHFSDLVGQEVMFAKDCLGDETKRQVSNLKKGEVLLLENLRFYKQETTGTEDFARELASYADVYVNDAFGTAHRAHASTTIIAKFFPQDKVFGYLMADEINNIEKVLNKPERPLTAILGGAKVSGKILIIEQLLNKIDNLIIGGGMAYTFAKAQGGNVGSSLVEDDRIETAREVLKQAQEKNVKIYLPTDTIWADSFSNDAGKGVSKIGEIPNGKMGLDIGPDSIEIFKEVIKNSKTILWNGPMGVFEMSNFELGTKSIAEAIVEATKNKTYSLVGGGDSVAAINKYNMATQVSYVSTGGGAMLEYLEGKVLPGVEAIKN